MPIHEIVIVNIRHEAMTLLNWFVFLSLTFFSRRKVYVQLSQGGKIARNNKQLCDADALFGVTTERRGKNPHLYFRTVFIVKISHIYTKRAASREFKMYIIVIST